MSFSEHSSFVELDVDNGEDDEKSEDQEDDGDRLEECGDEDTIDVGNAEKEGSH